MGAQLEHRLLELGRRYVTVAVAVKLLEQLNRVSLAHGALLGNGLEKRRGPSGRRARRLSILATLGVLHVEQLKQLTDDAAPTSAE